MKTQFRKVLRDLTSDYSKSIMLIVAIAIGVFGLGSILGGYSVIKREMKDNYMGTNPASATIEVERALTPGILDSVRRIPGISIAERHATLSARMKVGDKWHPMLLFVVDDFSNKKTNKIYYQSGVKVPPTGTMLVERTALVVMEANEGEEITVKVKNGASIKLKISGTVHDPGLAPAWQEQSGYGYITLSTLRLLDQNQEFDQLRILVSEEPFSKTHITKVAGTVASYLETAGYPIHEIQVPAPGKHPHQGQMTTIMTLFIIFSFLVLILGSILVATTISNLMVKHIRQIGMMKTIGAGSFQITRMYMLMIFIVSVAAIGLGIPLSRIAATAFYDQIATLLNLEIRDRTIPVMVSLIQVASGILLPLLVALIPVIRGSRITVKKALDNYGVSQKELHKNSWAIRFSRMSFVGETFRLSIRNAFRQRSRLAMTVTLLASGGALFMTALNVSEAWDNNLKRIYVQRLYDLELRLLKPAKDSVVKKIESLQGVKKVEVWSYVTTSFVQSGAYEITNTYPDKGHGSFTMLAMPLPTELLRPTITEGKWLTDSSSHEVVLNQLARGKYKIGDLIYLSVEGESTEWKIVGFTEDVGSPATAYVSQKAFASESDGSLLSKMLRIAYADRSKTNARQMNRTVEELLERENVSITSAVPVWLLHSAIAGHMKVLVNSLLVMAILMAIVGALGLMSTMSMSILERTREIGVMRAIGATPNKISKLIVWEGLLIGVISMAIAFIASLVLSYFMGNMLGLMSFRTPLVLTISLKAIVIWILIVTIGSYLATLLPSRRASKATVREALAYE